MAKSVTRQVSIFINGKEIENSIKAIAAEQRKLTNELANTIRGTAEYEAKAAELAKVNTLLRDHRQAISGIEKGWNLTKIGVGNFIGIAAGAFAVDNLLGYGKQLFGIGIQMDALNRKAQTVFGITLPAVTAEAKKNAEAMGLTTSQYINAAAAIQDILIPMGFQRQRASEISTQLVNLSGALSEWTGGQVSATEVSDILSSALTGERERLKQLGIVLQQSDIDARLAEKGLSKLTGTMKQQAEASATLELVLEKSTDAQAAFANGSDSAVRRQAELTAKIQEITEKLANLLLPVFEKLAAFAGSVVGAISDVVDGIDALVHPAKAATKAFDEQAEKVADLEGNISPLLDRYDELTGKSNLSKIEQDELKKIITQVSGVIPTAIQGFDDYGRALGLNTAAAREFIETERQRLQFVNQTAIQETEKVIEETKKRAEIVQSQLQSKRAPKQTINTSGFGTRIEFQDLTGNEIQKLQTEAQKLQNTLAGANAEVKRLKGENIPNAATTPPTGTGVTGGGTGDPNKAKKEAERLQKELTDLLETVAQRRRDLLAKEQEDELAITINGIEDRYRKEIAKAIELEKKGVADATAQRITLEELKQQEIGDAVAAYTEKSVEEAEKQAFDNARRLAEAQAEADRQSQEFLDQRQKEREDAQKQIDEFNKESLVESRLTELQELDTHYQALLALADDYGLDTTQIAASYRQQVADINKAWDAKDLEQRQQYNEAAAQLEIARLNAISDGAGIIGSFFEETSAIAKAAFLFQKTVAAAEILINLQIEIAKIAAANASLGLLGVPITAAQITAAKIRAGIGLATIAATAIKQFIPPKTKQKADGGYLTVTGETDGRTYNAAIIPSPHTGMLPPHPVLFQSQATGQPVLASERGAEYFISAQSLRNPYVANLTRMIDNIALTGGRRGIAQFAEGGATATIQTPPERVPVGEAMQIADLAAAIKDLRALLASGIVAVIPDRTLTAIPERLQKIDSASGGFFS